MASFSHSAVPRRSSNNTYPKIGSHITGLLEELASHAQRHNIDLSDTPIPFTGTVRLRGARAHIFHWPGWRIRAEIYNTGSATLEQDKVNFAAFCAERNKKILRLIDRVKQRWHMVHPGHVLSKDAATTLVGEWIEANARGSAPQPHSDARRFVLTGVVINDVWEHMEDYADLADQGAGLLNISEGGFFYLELSVDDNGETFMREAAVLTTEVLRNSSFSRILGTDEPATGIAWIPSASASIPNTPNFWLETKDRVFSGRQQRFSSPARVARNVVLANVQRSGS